MEGTLGAGQRSLATISIASPNGYLNLEREAVTGAEQSGTGTVDDVTVTYYDVTVDVVRMSDAPGLTPEQRATIERVVAVLDHCGYAGTEERIGIDDSGYIREVTVMMCFDDGSSLTLDTPSSPTSGAWAEVALPGEPAPEPRTEPWTRPSPTTTTAPPAVTTTVAPTSTTGSTTTTVDDHAGAAHDHPVPPPTSTTTP